MKETLKAQQEHWEKTFSKATDMFGAEPSEPARHAAKMFGKKGKRSIRP